MSSEVLIDVENVSKKFCRNLKRSLWYGVKDIGSELAGRSGHHDELRRGEFWAVKDVSFQVRRGECLGLIGPNGAGKTTLLRMLNGLIKPHKGKITMRGRVGALISLGAGFNPILTGRENVYAAGAVLGFTTKEIDAKYDAIVEFAELEEFMGTPVQSYSSGMQVRLGFAVAAQMEPDVLILDEVLAVGDMSFQARCFNAIYRLTQTSAVIFVSHSMPAISRICTHLSVIHKGEQCFNGDDVALGIEKYNLLCVQEKVCQVSGSGRASIHSVEFECAESSNTDTVNFGEWLKIHAEISIDKEIKLPGVAFTFLSEDMQPIAQCVSYFNKFSFENENKRMTVVVKLNSFTLSPGTYWLMVAVQSEDYGEILIRYTNYKKIKVKGFFNSGKIVQYLGKWVVKPCW